MAIALLSVGISACPLVDIMAAARVCGMLLMVLSMCLARPMAVQDGDDDQSNSNALNALYKSKEKSYDAKERVMHASGNAYADKWRAMMKKQRAKENQDIPFKVDPHSNLLLEDHPSNHCTSSDIFNFCTTKIRTDLSGWYHRDGKDGRFEPLPKLGFATACYPWLKQDTASRCRVSKGEADFWLNEAVSRDERFGKLSELLYECYKCVQTNVPQLNLKPALDVACATPKLGEVDRCEHRCSEKLAEKYKLPVLTKVCRRSESDFQGFGKHNYRIKACKEFEDEKKTLSKKQKQNDMSYEMEMDVCSCMKQCKRPMITCTPKKFSLADVQIADANAGICCASAEELSQHLGVAMLQQHDVAYGGHIFDYNSYTQKKVCSWNGQLDRKICKKRRKHGWKSTQNQCGRYTTRAPTANPTRFPTHTPTNTPTTRHPTRRPTKQPTMEPTNVSNRAFELSRFLHKHKNRYTIPTPAPTPCKRFDDDYDDKSDDDKKQSGCAHDV